MAPSRTESAIDDTERAIVLVGLMGAGWLDCRKSATVETYHTPADPMQDHLRSRRGAKLPEGRASA